MNREPKVEMGDVNGAFGEGGFGGTLEEFGEEYGELPKRFADPAAEEAESLARQRSFAENYVVPRLEKTLEARDTPYRVGKVAERWIEHIRSNLAESGRGRAELSGEAAAQFPMAFSAYTEAVGKMNGVEGAGALPVADEEKVKAEAAKLSEFVEKEKQAGRERQLVVYPTGASIEQAKALTREGDYFNEAWFRQCEKEGVKPFGEKTEAGFAVMALPVKPNLEDGKVAKQKAEIERRRAAGEKLVAPNLMAGYMYRDARIKAGKDPSIFFRMVESAPVRGDGGYDFVPYLYVWGDGGSYAGGSWVVCVSEGRAGSVGE
jgi:hypothetical protein